ncbi:hypothetical protein pEaSNUABM22_00064 [Erwinia phage pEa_SNUABM_22]|uniref:Uncharacterized protein n=1 Tax=Erwinia phage pEa_SNUABM_22 TaxID=2869549 RepID=A0AAE8XQZ2_9CAUD|nr:nucleoside triphosphate pyrophosphohydrolase [Erwinia phage pEa_SNUABM_22]UAW96552.1 hypothetical protein pEaSNUABM22_00064 [Erwinia phage pEa_SNUABM_22]
MALNHLQYALGLLAKASAQVSQAALDCQQHGFDHVDPKSLVALTAREHLISGLDDVAAAVLFVEREAGPHFEFVPDTRRALNKMDQLRSQLGFAIESGHAEGYEDEEDEEE